MKKPKLYWIYEGSSYSVGDSISEPWSQQMPKNASGAALVFCKNKLYWVHHYPRMGRIGLTDIYTGMVYWVNDDYVFQVLKID